MPFAKQHVPWNKGVNTNIKPTNIESVGTKKVNSYGFVLIKVLATGIWERDWQLLHKYLWRKKWGLVPANHVVLFKDGNKSNVTIENLELISRKEIMNRNTSANLPEDLRSTVHAKGILTRKINDRSK